MADNDPLADMFNLFAAPVAGTIRSVEQFRKGVDEFLRGVENFNTTMETLNETATRINTLLGEVEEPLRAAVPQVTRTVKAADEMMQVVAGPAMAVAPGLTVLSETLNNPAFKQMPNQFAQITELLDEMSKRMAPLGQLADMAGGMFGMRLPGFGGSRPADPATAPDDGDDEDDGTEPEAEAAPRPAKKSAAKKKKTAARKSSAPRTSAAKKKNAD